MNYLSHALPLLGRPYAVAGSSLPDWLRARGRRYRVVPGTLPAAAPRGSPEAELLVGVRRHLADDHWFHRAPAFRETTRRLRAILRAAPAPRTGRARRAGFLAHVLLEMLLDAWWMETDPAHLARYDAALAGIDVDRVAAFAATLVSEVPPHLAPWIEGFRRARILDAYRHDDTLHRRLGQVAARVGVSPPPPPGPWLSAARALVRREARVLLTPPVVSPL